MEFVIHRIDSDHKTNTQLRSTSKVEVRAMNLKRLVKALSLSLKFCISLTYQYLEILKKL